jgi:hypothetical protein
MIYSKFNLKLGQNDFLLPIPETALFLNWDVAFAIDLGAWVSGRLLDL